MDIDADDFQSLLAQAGIKSTPPLGFVPCPTSESSISHYQYALRSPSGDLELRYRIDAFVRMEAEKQSVAMKNSSEGCMP